MKYWSAIRLSIVKIYFCQDNIKAIRKKNRVAIAAGFHLFPFRTEKLSPPAPMVLQCNAGEQDAAFFQIHESLRVIKTLRLSFVCKY